MKFRIAFASDDENNMVNKHFGEANFYMIYEISKLECIFIEKRENTITEKDERFHGDPKKANKISKIVPDVQVLCNKQFGENIKNMVKKYVPIVFDIENIDKAIEIIQSNFDKITEGWNNKEIKKHIIFRNRD